MCKTYSVKINRKDLYKENYNQKEYRDKEGEKKVMINKSLVEVFIKMIAEYA